jgi:predicted GTPase
MIFTVIEKIGCCSNNPQKTGNNVQYKSRNCFGLIKNICTEHDYDLFIINYSETSHAKGYNINIKTYLQVVLSHYTSISSKTDKISKCVVSVILSAPFRH